MTTPANPEDPEIPVHDGSMPLLIGDVLETLHTLETFYNIFNAALAILVLLGGFAAFAVALVLPANPSPFTTWTHWELVLPLFGGLLVLVAGITWAHNRSSAAQMFFNICGVVWALGTSALVIWLFVERFILCPNNMPLQCTDGVTSDIIWQYDFYFFTTFIHWFCVVVLVIIFNFIQRNIRRLEDPMTGMTRADLVAEFFARPGRYLHSVGSAFAMDTMYLTSIKAD